MTGRGDEDRAPGLAGEGLGLGAEWRGSPGAAPGWPAKGLGQAGEMRGLLAKERK